MAVEQRARTASGIVLEPQYFHPNAIREIVAYAISSNAGEPAEPREMIVKRDSGEMVVASSVMLEEIMHLPKDERLAVINEVAEDCSNAKAIILKATES